MSEVSRISFKYILIGLACFLCIFALIGLGVYLLGILLGAPKDTNLPMAFGSAAGIAISAVVPCAVRAGYRAGRKDQAERDT